MKPLTIDKTAEPAATEIISNLPVPTAETPRFQLGLTTTDVGLDLIRGKTSLTAHYLTNTILAGVSLFNYFAIGFALNSGHFYGANLNMTLLITTCIAAVTAFIRIPIIALNQNKNVNDLVNIITPLAEMVRDSTDLKNGVNGLVEAIEGRSRQNRAEFDLVMAQPGHLKQKLAFATAAEHYKTLADEIKKTQESGSVSEILDLLGHKLHWRDALVGNAKEAPVLLDFAQKLINGQYDALLAKVDAVYSPETIKARLEEGTSKLSLRAYTPSKSEIIGAIPL